MCLTGTWKNGPRKNGPQEKSSPENWSPEKWSRENWSPEKYPSKIILRLKNARKFKRLFHFYQLIPLHTQKDVWRLRYDPTFAPNCRTLKESRKIRCRVLGFHRLITSEHSTHTHHDARRSPHDFSFLSFSGTNFPRTIFPGTNFPGTIFRGDHFSGILDQSQSLYMSISVCS